MSNINSSSLKNDIKNSIIEKKDNYLQIKKEYKKKILLSKERIYKYNIEINELSKSKILLRLQYNNLIKNLNFEKKYEESQIKKLNLPYLVVQDQLEESKQEYVSLINDISAQDTQKINEINSRIRQCKNLIELEQDKIKKFKKIIFKSSNEYNNYLKKIIKTNNNEFIKIKENYDKQIKGINNEIFLLKKEGKNKKESLINNFKKQNSNIKFVRSKLFFWNLFGISKLKNKNSELLYKLYVELNNLKRDINNHVKENIDFKKEEFKNKEVIFLNSYKQDIREEIKDVFLKKVDNIEKNSFLRVIIHVSFGIIPLLFMISILTLVEKVILPIEDGSYGLLSMIIVNPSKKTLDVLNNIILIIHRLSIICFELVPILVIVLMSICLGNYYKINKIICLLLSISTYLILAPSVLSWEFYGIKDLFSAFFGTYITIKLYSVLNNLIKIKIIGIKYLSDDFYEVFNSILLFLLIMLFFSAMQIGLLWIIKSLNLLDQIFLKSNVLSFNSMLSMLIQIPLLKIYNCYGGFVLIVFLRQLFVFIGFNDKILFSTLYEVQDSNIFYNLNALLSPNDSYFVDNRTIFTSQFLVQILDMGGGPGGLIVVVVLNVFLSKEKDIRLLSIFSLLFVLFNINDLFFIALPLLFNLVLFIPFVVSPLIIGTISYIATKIELMPYTIYQVTQKPITILSGYLATGNSILILWWFIIFFLYFVCYLPFIFLQNKLYDWNSWKKTLSKTIDATNVFELDDILILKEN